MKRVILMVVAAAVLACGKGSDESEGSDAPVVREPVESIWTPSATGVECPNADWDFHTQLPWEDLDHDGVVAYDHANGGATDPGDLEDTIECVWYCSTSGSSHAVKDRIVFFAFRGGTWTEMKYAEGPAICY